MEWKRGSQKGMEFRTNFGELNSFVLDSLRGLDETIQYGQGEKRKEQMSERSKNLAGSRIIKQDGRLTAFLYEHGYPACIFWNAGTDHLAV